VPASANFMAVAAPIPREAPVIKTVRSLKSSMLINGKSPTLKVA